MKKTITTIFTGLGLLAIALAIYFKKGPCTNTQTCSGQKCCLTDTSERETYFIRARKKQFVNLLIQILFWMPMIKADFKPTI